MRIPGANNTFIQSRETSSRECGQEVVDELLKSAETSFMVPGDTDYGDPRDRVMMDIGSLRGDSADVVRVEGNA